MKGIGRVKNKIEYLDYSLLYKKRNILNGSVTVEASLVFPIFFFTICFFYSFFLILSAETVIGESLVQTGRFVSQYGAIKEVNNNIVKMDFQKNLITNQFKGSCIKGGNLGVHLLCERYGKNEEELELTVYYLIQFPINIFHFNSIPAKQKIRVRLFVGKEMNHSGADWNEGNKENQEMNDQIVYITENGVVYHKNRNCSHLQFSIKNIPISTLKYARNINGGKYKKCAKCGKVKNKEEKNQTVYIALEGNRYHTSLSCSGLKRTVLEVKLSTVKNWSCCLRCG